MQTKDVEASWTEQSTDRGVGKLRGVDLLFIPDLSCILALPINKAAPTPPTPDRASYWELICMYRIGRALILSTFLRQ